MRSLAGAREDAAEAGQVVDRQILRAVANGKPTVVMVDGLQSGSRAEETDTGAAPSPTHVVAG